MVRLHYELMGSRQTSVYSYEEYAKVHMHNFQGIHGHVRHRFGLAKVEMQEYFSKSAAESWLGEDGIRNLRQDS